MNLTISPNGIELPPGSEVILRHQSWADYEGLLASRRDRAAVKVYFGAKKQEVRLMAPLPGHSNRSATLTDLVKVLLRHQNQDWHVFDPLTLKRVSQTGVEPDACFYIQNRLAILGKERIDLEVDPPPDLALEVDLTSFTQPQDYEAIAIPELWIYRSQGLRIYLFDGQQYRDSEVSHLFPEIAVKQLIPRYIELAWRQGSSSALQAFEAELASAP